MKKIIGLLLASTLILGACGDNSESKSENKTKSVNENNKQFKDNTLVIDDAVLKIKDTFIVNNENSDGKELAFTYEVKNKTDKEEITAINVWLATMTAKQDSDNTVNDLEVGTTPTTGKYEKWYEHANDTIKKDKQAKGIITYTLQNDEDVSLKATKGAEGKELGTKKIKLDDLKTVDYSASDDITSESEHKDEVSSTNNNDEFLNEESTGDMVASASEIKDKPQASETQQVDAQTESSNVSNDISQNVNSQQNPTEENTTRIPYDKDHTTLHDESQTEKQQQAPENGAGGHPSAFDPSIPKESQGVAKVDSNGDEYFDATGE
ncbi:DUF5067 domain-containing protein [Staphylococcus equorum]|uniref:DUF5067 domain-containing protein n=1 Tax=Staphylococcus equorum TaxID=246432 RepID=UPI003CE987BE